MEKCNVLITGASGFIGSHVVRRFLTQNQYHVVAISRKPSNHTRSNPESRHNITWIHGKFFEKELLEQVFLSYPIRYVLHLAALRGAGSGDDSDYTAVNVEGTERVLEASLKYRIQRLVFCSSVGVYGTIPAELPATTSTLLHGDNLYHASKIQAEKKVRHAMQRGLNAYIVRPTITYGVGDNGFPKTLVELVRRKRFLLSTADVMIHLLSVSKFAELLQQMLEAKSGSKQDTFIAADKNPISLQRLADQIHQHYYNRPYPSFLTVPDNCFFLLRALFRMVHNEKWLTRILLISQSWHYDIRETVQSFSYAPANTQEAFIREMQL